MEELFWKLMHDANGYDTKIQEAQLDKSENRDPDRILNLQEEKSFRSSLGMLAWLARITRPDLAYESAACAQAFAEKYELGQNYDLGEVYTDAELSLQKWEDLSTTKPRKTESLQ